MHLAFISNIAISLLQEIFLGRSGAAEAVRRT